MVTQTAITMNNSLSIQCSATKTAQYPKVIQSADIEMTLIRAGMALCSMKLEMYGPRRG